ncbi:GAF domain-containing sensor histidine kinase [Mucilaginibacter sp. RS28]|uniref:histidine kinase n=1 Tax=Mucilaginibacter straminoryzae TaxID=2932774 RepID=A0A9X1X395_9SPHI|nr:GAF domain-containing sensor histidine kinase [Mucilaginibacter straminoryzae]MCJ8210462.1 GAF domain-containing sensor histidine kinase [Mucilaginibacter straminoryzae]
MNNVPPIPADEFDRISALSNLDLDYSNLNDSLKDLTRLAAKVAGTDISLINLIDSFTQWSVANYGLEIEQLPREDSICQYTIVSDEKFEVKNLSLDDRFKDKLYVTGDPNVRYYYGVPLRADGYHIGALCVLDPKEDKALSPEKEELLRIIAGEIVTRLKILHLVESLQDKVKTASETQRRLAHDIRGPLGGIIGLANVIAEQGDENQMEEVLEFVTLIYKSGKSILELADEILGNDQLLKKADKLNSNQFNLAVLKEKLLKLYGPQAKSKHVKFEVVSSPDNEKVPFSKNKLLQIVGNLVSNAIKFTPADGLVSVKLSLNVGTKGNTLQIVVSDTGVGMTEDKIQMILTGKGESTTGTGGEQGYGFGLALVKHLMDSLKGKLSITSEPEKGTSFTLELPQFES